MKESKYNLSDSQNHLLAINHLDESTFLCRAVTMFAVAIKSNMSLIKETRSYLHHIYLLISFAIHEQSVYTKLSIYY